MIVPLLSVVTLSLVAYAAPQKRATGGTLLLAGGALNENSDVYAQFVSLAGGKGVAKIGVITAASALPKDDPNANDPDKCSNSVCNGIFYKNIIKNNFGAADAPWIPVDLDHIAAASQQSTVDLINQMSGFFIGGGDQSRLVTCFKKSDGSDSPALAALRAKLSAGAVVMGTSAGTAITNAKDMVTGGESYEGLLNGAYSSISSSHPDDLSYDAGGGFGFITSGLIDTHFGARGRHARIVRLASDRGHNLAYGIDEDTVMMVKNVNTAAETLSVLGTNGVSILDLRSSRTSTRSSHWAINGVRFTYLTAGDSYATASGAVTTSKQSYKPSSGRAMSRPEDIFSSPNSATAHPMVLINTTKDLIGAGSSTTNYGISYESGPTYEAHMTKDDKTLAWKDSTATSWQNVVLDFYVY
jgi:cyanophycinase